MKKPLASTSLLFAALLSSQLLFSQSFAADGGEVHVGDKVIIAGKLSVAPNVCFIKVDTITKAQ